jgi:hypothetical protein
MGPRRDPLRTCGRWTAQVGVGGTEKKSQNYVPGLEKFASERTCLDHVGR